MAWHGREIGHLLLAAAMVLPGCSGGDGGADGRNAPAAAPDPSAPPAHFVPGAAQNCLTLPRLGDGLPVSRCVSRQARARIRDLYRASIADGSIMQLHGGFDPRHYPGEVVASVMAIAEDEHDAALMKWSVRTLEEIRARLVANNGVHLWPEQIDGAPTFGELAQSRMVLSLALIYRATGNRAAKAGAEAAFAALIRFPRVRVTSSITGNTYWLPTYAYHDIARPVAISKRVLDPNHDAVLAAAYHVMARHVLTDPAAVASAVSEAEAYTAAALDLTAAGRCLPLSDQPEYIDACDTRYNGYWGFLMEIVSRYSSRTDVRPGIDKQIWYIRSSLAAFQTRRTYPKAMSGSYPDPVEPLMFWNSLRRNMSVEESASFVDETNNFMMKNNIADWPRGNLYPKYFQ